MTWHVRPIQPQEEEPFLSFLSDWVKDISVRKRYQWLYQNNPHGKALTWLAIDTQTDRIVGCTSVFPKKLWLNDRVILGSAGGDTYVDPLWRRKGIAETLYRVELKEMQESGIRFMYGFPLAANLRALCKAGAHLPGHFSSPRLFVSLHPFLSKVKLDGIVPQGALKALDKIFIKATSLRTLKSSETRHAILDFNDFDETFGTLTQEIAPFFNICGVRDGSYLRWRFLDNPFRRYILKKAVRKEDGRLDGFTAIEISGKNGTISDFFARPEEGVVEALLMGVIRFGVSKSLHSLSLMMNPAGPYYKNFIRCGFGCDRSDKKTFEVFGDVEKDGLKDLKNWYLTLSDLDI